jgi:hypothetical protein
MKINTRQTTPLSPSCMVNPNKNIPKNAGTPASAEGRQIKFQPTVVFTPVMTSDRTKRASPEKRPPRLSQDQVDDVCNLLSTLFINDAKEEETREEIDETGDTFGSFAQVIASNDMPSNATITVRRSARLAACKS